MKAVLFYIGWKDTENNHVFIRAKEYSDTGKVKEWVIINSFDSMMSTHDGLFHDQPLKNYTKNRHHDFIFHSTNSAIKALKKFYKRNSKTGELIKDNNYE